MIIPSLDIMGGKAVQLRQGKERVLTSDRDPIELAIEFNRYGPVACIDLDAALGVGDNLELIKRICRVAELRCGGGIREFSRGQALLRAGAQKLIIGTAAVPELLERFPKERVMVALDNLDGEVLDQGWKRGTGEKILERATRLAPYCSGFLCTFVKHEGMLEGLPIEVAQSWQEKLPHPTTFAGGVADSAEAIGLCRADVDIQVGMALYTGKLELDRVVVGSLDFDKSTLIPTVVQDDAGQVLMLAYSSPESLSQALTVGKGIYFSRSRQQLWEKGATSGNVQKLLSCRMDCDRDALVFLVEQTGVACHTGRYSCFGSKRFSMEDLFRMLARRKAQQPQGSYTTRLFKDPDLLERQLMEEAFELTRTKSSQEAQWESADLLYFMAVLAVRAGLDWTDLQNELSSRHRADPKI